MKIVVQGEKKNLFKDIVKWFRQKIYNIKMVWLDFKGFYIKRYHIVDCRSLENNFRGGWLDRSELLMYAMFAVLVDFMEKEYPGLVGWRYDEDIRRVDDELHVLYDWWKNGRKKELAEIDELLERREGEPEMQMLFVPTENPQLLEMKVVKTQEQLDRSKEWMRRTEEFYAKEEDMMNRLIKIRKHMWT